MDGRVGGNTVKSNPRDNTSMNETHVVTAFLRNRGEVLLLRRSDEVGSYAGRWGSVSGHAECEDPVEDARREIREETGIEDATLIRCGDSFAVEDEDLERRWIVLPFLFDSLTRNVESNWETVETAWVSPTKMLRRETVPDLWASYTQVAPTVETVAGDRKHGSAYISIRALEVLRDRAGVLASEETGSEESDFEDAWTQLATLARDLLAARPSMAVVTNRVNRVMAEAAAKRTAAAVERAAIEGIEQAFTADAVAATHAAEFAAGKTVCTLSRSGTVLDALLGADPEPSVLIAESRPACEGVEVAEELAAAGLDVTLCTDAAMTTLIPELDVECVLVGADAVLPDGRVVNKVGTRAAALAAAREGIPTDAVASTDKIALSDNLNLVEGDEEDIYNSKDIIYVRNPLFEIVESDLITSFITEKSVMGHKDVSECATTLREMTTWE